MNFSFFINKRCEQRDVQGPKEIRYRKETIEHNSLPRLECDLNSVKSGIKIRNIGRSKEVTVNVILFRI